MIWGHIVEECRNSFEDKFKENRRRDSSKKCKDHQRKESPIVVSIIKDIKADIKNLLECNSSFVEIDDDSETPSGSYDGGDEDLLPDEFQMQENWHYLNDLPEEMSNELICLDNISRLIACRCMNIRGAIVHGKRPGLIYEPEEMSYRTVEEVFDAFGEGYKKLKTIYEIKFELMNNGPIVSTSFKLSKAFQKGNGIDKSFLSQHDEVSHPILITGWKCTEFGEVWICNSIDSSKNHIVAFGHFCINDNCIAPKCDFRNTTWQPGPYFDYDFSNVTDDWRSWPNLKMYLKSEDLERLGACFEHGFVSAVKPEVHFELCERNRRAHSRTCCLKELGWDAERRKWRVATAFVDCG